ncbi:hypothetical protein K3495_g12191 [Podosphaera aphanis]|nr:hypothetical protein K3495_g12191 [Podosphaera aphanis]
MENIIDNLMTKDSTKFANVNKQLLDLQSQKTANGSNSSSKACFAAKDSSPSQVKRKKECNRCKKRGENYQGHVHSECRKLKAFKEKQKSDGNGKFDNRREKAILAATSPTYSSPDIVSTEDFAIEKAFTTCFSASNLPTHWILDSGSSSHMTSCREQLVSINNYRMTVTVANGEQVPVLGIRTIH